ncbi:MAG: hypothetical protein ABI127_06630 [Dokdonella sp.]
MNTRIPIAKAAMLLTTLFSCGAFAAGEPARMNIFVDCAHPALPSQSETGELLGQSNFSQVYASRASLMAEMHRACRRTHAESLNLVINLPGRNETHGRLVANNVNGRQ